jgi:uncharacterized membrane protein YciS (DUF1049 family)
LRRIFNWIIGVPIAIVIIGFAIANRQWQQVSFDPFSQETPFASITMPLWALLFCGIFLGILAGWAGCWFAQAKWRKAAREARIDLDRAERDLRRLKDEKPAPADEIRTYPVPLGNEPF